MITTQQIKQLQTLCSKRFSDREERLFFLSEMVGEPIETVKDLTEQQATGIIYHLNTGNSPDNSYYARFNQRNNQHLKILSLARQLGWVSTTHIGRRVADLNRLGTWLISKRSPVRKPLTKMNKLELSKIIFALEQMTQKKYEATKRS